MNSTSPTDFLRDGARSPCSSAGCCRSSATFIAFPAGVSRMRLLPFSIYTLVRLVYLVPVLAYAGMKFGQHWDALAPYFHRFDAVLAVLLVVGVAAFLYNRINGLTSAPTVEHD